MSLKPGTRLGSYTIVAPIGQGGMGEVYAAEDDTLHRNVALKILTPEMASEERRHRFEREAQAIAALRHPNIVTIHSIEEYEGIHFITMELVPGETLTGLIPKTGMSLNEFFELAIPLADAVSAAHAKGIVHRDLKPDNLMVSDEGWLKILDFGLAKIKQDTLSKGLSELPTQSATQEGRILGTVAYMSPEQVEGASIDHRSDIFSIGIILYEMVTGERPFKGDSTASMLSSILKDTPPSVTHVRRELPRDLGKMIRRCLAKNPEDRYQSAKDLRNELKELKQELDCGELVEGVPAQVPKRPPWLRWLLVSSVALVFFAVSAVYILRTQPDRGRAEEPLTGTFMQLTADASLETTPSLSPDGQFFVYAGNATGNWDIYFRRVGGKNAINLTQDCEADDTQPAFSPDGAHIVFRSERDGGGLYVMEATGEFLRRLTDFGYDPSWSPDGKRIICSTHSGSHDPVVYVGAEGDLWSVDMKGTEPQLIAEGSFRQPRWSPHGHCIAYRRLIDIGTIGVDGEEDIPVTVEPSTEWNPVWSPDGKYLYFTSDRTGDTNIWRVRIDEATGQVLGEPEPITMGTGTETWQPDISAEGRRLVYSARRVTFNIQRVSFDPVAETIYGEPEWVTTTGGLHPDISPDGQWLVFDHDNHVGPPGSVVISIIKPDGTGSRQITNSSHRDRYPRWSPDGKGLAFRSDRSGSNEIWRIDLDGSNLVQLTDTPGKTMTLPIWSPDGSRLASSTIGSPGNCYTYGAADPWSVNAPHLLPVLEQGDGLTFRVYSWSPDGKQLAGWHSETGTPTETVTNLSIYSFETDRFRTLDKPGLWPMWLSDGRRLLYMTSKARDPVVYALLDVVTGRQHEVLSDRILNLPPAERIHYTIDVSPDDRYIYFARRRDEADIWMFTFNETK